jgi:hypothetical protein
MAQLDWIALRMRLKRASGERTPHNALSSRDHQEPQNANSESIDGITEKSLKNDYPLSLSIWSEIGSKTGLCCYVVGHQDTLETSFFSSGSSSFGGPEHMWLRGRAKMTNNCS